MAGNNPYAAPKANLDRPDSGGIDTTSPFSPKGRFARSTYLAYSFGTTFGFGLLMGVLGAIGLMSKNLADMGIVGWLVTIAAYIAVLAASTIFGVRRLHDLNWSGWWLAVMFVPFVGLVLAIPMLFFRGTAGPNKYGPPRPPRTLHVVLAWIMVLFFVVGIAAAIAIPAYVDYTKRAKAAQSAQQPPAVEQPQDQRP